jgi:L-asparagine oxygenase
MAPQSLFSSQPQRISISADEKRQLAAFAHNQPSGDGIHADQHLMARVDREPLAFPSLEGRLRSLCTEQAISLLLIDNLPLDPHLPPSPANGARPAGKSWASESALLQFSRAGGLHPFGYEEENMGALIHQITPADGHAQEVSSAGVAALGFHSDLAILGPSYRPEFLFLAGLRNEASTPTLIAELDDALAILRLRHSRVESILREPRFRLESPALLQLWGGKRLVSEPRCLLTPGSLGRDIVAANLNSVIATDSEARSALSAFQDVLPEVARQIVIGPGEALLFNNQRCLHGRPAIQQSGQRWLQRLYSRCSLRQLREATASGPRTVIFPISRLILE